MRILIGGGVFDLTTFRLVRHSFFTVWPFYILREQFKKEVEFHVSHYEMQS